MSGAWGSGTWGSGSWGGGGEDFEDEGFAVAIRENVVRVEFSQEVFFTGLLEPEDASRREKWTVTEDASTAGLTGDAARPVAVVRAELAGAEDGVGEADYGRFVNLILDRPLTPFPSAYSVAWEGVFSADLSVEAEGSAGFQGAYRRVDQPTIESPRKSMDFANPQTVAAARTSVPNPTAAIVLGTFATGDDGDYAVDEGVQSIRKRCMRRIFTRKNGFAHLPGYGVGLPQAAKKNGSPDTLASLRADAEEQISREPDVARVRVQIVRSSATPSLVRFRAAVKPKFGPAFAFDAPFDAS